MKHTGRMIPYLMSMFGKKPYTVLYPFEPAKVAPNFRGALKMDREKCVGCKMCMRVCPSNAIEIAKIEEKQFKAVVRLDKCIYCGQCAYSCPRKALSNTAEFELAGFDRKAMKVEI